MKAIALALLVGAVVGVGLGVAVTAVLDDPAGGGAPMALEITSPSFENSEGIPRRFTGFPPRPTPSKR